MRKPSPRVTTPPWPRTFPWSCRRIERSYSASSAVNTAPPSPQVMTLLSWKLVMPMSPSVPDGWPR